ncbi:hypothetical protein BC831DRAFT_470277, partial [Entophlyctis helioformis]
MFETGRKRALDVYDSDAYEQQQHQQQQAYGFDAQLFQQQPFQQPHMMDGGSARKMARLSSADPSILAMSAAHMSASTAPSPMQQPGWPAPSAFAVAGTVPVAASAMSIPIPSSSFAAASGLDPHVTASVHDSMSISPGTAGGMDMMATSPVYHAQAASAPLSAGMGLSMSESIAAARLAQQQKPAAEFHPMLLRQYLNGSYH